MKRRLVLDVLGGVFWTIGFTFEALGDWQLMKFKGDPRNHGMECVATSLSVVICRCSECCV